MDTRRGSLLSAAAITQKSWRDKIRFYENADTSYQASSAPSTPHARSRHSTSHRHARSRLDDPSYPSLLSSPSSASLSSSRYGTSPSERRRERESILEVSSARRNRSTLAAKYPKYYNSSRYNNANRSLASLRSPNESYASSASSRRPVDVTTGLFPFPAASHYGTRHHLDRSYESYASSWSSSSPLARRHNHERRLHESYADRVDPSVFVSAIDTTPRQRANRFRPTVLSPTRSSSSASSSNSGGDGGGRSSTDSPATAERNRTKKARKHRLSSRKPRLIVSPEKEEPSAVERGVASHGVPPALDLYERFVDEADDGKQERSRQRGRPKDPLERFEQSPLAGSPPHFPARTSTQQSVSTTGNGSVRDSLSEEKQRGGDEAPAVATDAPSAGWLGRFLKEMAIKSRTRKSRKTNPAVASDLASYEKQSDESFLRHNQPRPPQPLGKREEAEAASGSASAEWRLNGSESSALEHLHILALEEQLDQWRKRALHAETTMPTTRQGELHDQLAREMARKEAHAREVVRKLLERQRRLEAELVEARARPAKAEGPRSHSKSDGENRTEGFRTTEEAAVPAAMNPVAVMSGAREEGQVKQQSPPPTLEEGPPAVRHSLPPLRSLSSTLAGPPSPTSSASSAPSSVSPLPPARHVPQPLRQSPDGSSSPQRRPHVEDRESTELSRAEDNPPSPAPAAPAAAEEAVLVKQLESMHGEASAAKQRQRAREADGAERVPAGQPASETVLPASVAAAPAPAVMAEKETQTDAVVGTASPFIQQEAAAVRRPAVEVEKQSPTAAGTAQTRSAPPTTAEEKGEKTHLDWDAVSSVIETANAQRKAMGQLRQMLREHSEVIRQLERGRLEAHRAAREFQMKQELSSLTMLSATPSPRPSRYAAPFETMLGQSAGAVHPVESHRWAADDAPSPQPPFRTPITVASQHAADADSSHYAASGEVLELAGWHERRRTGSPFRGVYAARDSFHWLNTPANLATSPSSPSSSPRVVVQPSRRETVYPFPHDDETASTSTGDALGARALVDAIHQRSRRFPTTTSSPPPARRRQGSPLPPSRDLRESRLSFYPNETSNAVPSPLQQAPPPPPSRQRHQMAYQDGSAIVANDGGGLSSLSDPALDSLNSFEKKYSFLF